MKHCNESTTTVYHYGTHLNDPNFDLEDSFCSRLNQIRGVAGLFHAALRHEGRSLHEEECNGIHNILEDAAEELRIICYHMLKNQGVNHG